MRVCDYITQELINRGVTHVFTLPGGYSMYLNDSIGHSKLMPIYMLHESGAAFAASGWAKYTGKMGLCVVTSGLAQTNALSGVASAYSDYLPMMVISGDINTEQIIKRNNDNLRQGGQQDVPITNIANSITKIVVTVFTAHQVKMYFELLWKLALTEPRGPVWLNIPLNVQKEEMVDD